MSDIDVTIRDEQPIEVSISEAQPINVNLGDDIQVNIEEAQPISVAIEDAQPVNISLGEAVNIFPNGAVRSVNGKDGTVVLDAADVGADAAGAAATAQANAESYTDAALISKADKTELFSGDYNDLTNKPTIPDVSGKADKTYVDSQNSAQDTVISNKEPKVTAGTTSQYYRGDKTFQTLNKAAVGLSNVPNTDFTSAVAANTAKNSYPSADSAKLAGIESGATANSSDASLRNRATHTGTQAISTIVGLQTALDYKADTSSLADVATSGDYDDLINKPTAPPSGVSETLAIAYAVAL